MKLFPVSKPIPATDIPHAVLFSDGTQRYGLPVLLLRVTKYVSIKVHPIIGHEGPEEE
jgi:hypothetical protein